MCTQNMMNKDCLMSKIDLYKGDYLKIMDNLVVKSNIGEYFV